MRVGINGMGRIGRLALRAAFAAAERPADDPRGANRLDVVHVNEIEGAAAATAHLLAFDSVQGRWRAAIAADIPWGDLGVDLVLECTGKFLTAETLQPRCIETAVTAGAITGTRKLCYDRGMLQGTYTLTGSDGRVRESGFFEDNRPVGSWGFFSDAATMAVAGTCNNSGMATGEWVYHDTAGRPMRKVPFNGVYTPSGRTPLLRTLEGSYTEIYTSGPNAYQTGSLVKGQKSGPWSTYAPTTLASNDGTMIVREELWDPTTLVRTGTFCHSTGDCVPTSTSQLRSLRTYNWVRTCPYTFPWMEETRYGTDGRPTGSTCYRITGTPKSSTVSALPSCPTVSCQ